MSSAAELDAGLASAFGVALETAPWLPAEDAEPEELLRAAEQIGHAIGDRRAVPIAERAWTGLPARPSVAASPDERRSAIARVLAWANAAGASWDGIEFHVDADGNASVRASRTISPGAPILTLPRRLMIVDHDLGASTTGAPALGLAEPRPRDTLAAWLALEAREPGSRWRAYLDALPAQLAELPMFHDADDLAALAGTAAYALAAEGNRDVLDTYGRLSWELRARLSLADFAWGCALVKSRGFHAPGFVEHRLALLPVVEFFNHRVGDTTWSYDPLAELFVVTTERGFSIGDEVHFTYGDHSNTLLLVHFGFAAPSTPTREAGLLFACASDPVNAVAAHLLWNLPLDAPARLRVGTNLDHRFLRALSLARLQASGPAERARALDGGLAAYGDMPWLDGTLEEAAFAVLAAAARRALGELDAHTPRAADHAWGRTCAIVRDAERAVLDEILELTSAVREYLHVQDPARLRAAADSIPADAIGAQCLLRQYLRALARELITGS